MSTKWTIVVVSVLAIAIATALVSRYVQRDHLRWRIGNETFNVLVADSSAERQQGLSGLPSLDDGTVMLFIFPADGRHGFWMKEMRFAIDIVWLDRQGRIVHIEERVVPETYPHVFVPMDDARYVIEMNAGTAERLQFMVGQQLEAWPSG